MIDLEEPKIKPYGVIDQETLESILVGFWIADPDIDKEILTTKVGDTLSQSGIVGEWFEHEVQGRSYDKLMEYFRSRHRLPTIDEIENLELLNGISKKDQVVSYRLFLTRCHAAKLTRKIGVDIAISRMKHWYLTKKAEQIYQTFAKDRANVEVGPEKAIINLRASILKDLTDPGAGIVKEYDWIKDFDTDLSWLKDMKDNPEKYRGYLCNMDVIDKKTGGFRPGQLTVFVGTHGGFKSTLMINIAYGLWDSGYDVLFISLEMEATIVKTKLWCRASKRLSFSKLYKGQMVEPEDWDKMDEIRAQLALEQDEEAKARLQFKLVHLEEATASLKKGQDETDISILRNTKTKLNSKGNKLKIINIGQSKKIKLSQIESWLDERDSEFRPHVVIFDYLDLIAPEQPYPDRRDLELGDICKYMRSMGENRKFSSITAAQLKRDTIARIRKYGFDNPEKVQFGTDDISGSSQIGADADLCCVLWRKDAGRRLQMFWTKHRHGEANPEKADEINVDPDKCWIGQDVEGVEKDKPVMNAGNIKEHYKEMLEIEPENDPDGESDDHQVPIKTAVDTAPKVDFNDVFKG